MKAFHNDPAIKKKYLQRLQEHHDLDQIIKGLYWQDGKGCAVGCTIHDSKHANYETELGIPESLAHLEDGIFEGLPNDLAMEWPLKFLKAIPVGADLSLVASKFLHWLLVDPTDGVIQHAKDAASKKVIQDVADLYTRKIAGDNPTAEEWAGAEAGAGAVWMWAAGAREKQAVKLLELLEITA